MGEVHMNKRFLLSMFLVCTKLSDLEASSVQGIPLTSPITQLSFEMNNEQLSIETATINSLLSVLNSGAAVTFSASVTTAEGVYPDGAWGQEETETNTSYSLAASSPAWPGGQNYTIIPQMQLSGSCVLRIDNQKTITMPVTNDGAVSIKMQIPSVQPGMPGTFDSLHLNGILITSIVLSDSYGHRFTVNQNLLNDMNARNLNWFTLGYSGTSSTTFFIRLNEATIAGYSNNLNFPITITINDNLLTYQIPYPGKVIVYSKS